MDLPAIERGMAILAEHINRITREVRSNQLTSVVGGRFNRTAMGTTIDIDKGFWGASGGTAVVCPFKVSDATVSGTKKVKIKSGLIDGRWPKGMGPDLPDPELNVSGTGYVYCVIQYDANYEVIAGEDAYQFQFLTDIQTNDDSHQYVLIAVVVVEGDIVSSITNQCVQPTAIPCSLIIPD